MIKVLLYPEHPKYDEQVHGPDFLQLRTTFSTPRIRQKRLELGQTFGFEVWDTDYPSRPLTEQEEEECLRELSSLKSP